MCVCVEGARGGGAVGRGMLSDHGACPPCLPIPLSGSRAPSPTPTPAPWPRFPPPLPPAPPTHLHLSQRVCSSGAEAGHFCPGPAGAVQPGVPAPAATGRGAQRGARAGAGSGGQPRQGGAGQGQSSSPSPLLPRGRCAAAAWRVLRGPRALGEADCARGRGDGRGAARLLRADLPRQPLQRQLGRRAVERGPRHGTPPLLHPWTHAPVSKGWGWRVVPKRLLGRSSSTHGVRGGGGEGGANLCCDGARGGRGGIVPTCPCCLRRGGHASCLCRLWQPCPQSISSSAASLGKLAMLPPRPPPSP